MQLALAQSPAHEDMAARVHRRRETIRQQKAVWPGDYPTFASQALIIRPKTAAPRKFVLNSVQRKLNARLENQRAETGMVRALVLKARQMGVSTYVGGRFYHRMRHSPGYRGIIMAHRKDASENLSEMVERYHDNDPMPPDIDVDNTGEKVFGNGSGYSVMVAGTVKTGAGRGHTFQLAHLSELAFWSQAADHMNALLRAVPAVEGSEVIIESTANGAAGPFYTMAMAAQSGVGRFELHFYPWFDHDEYSMEPPRGWQPNDVIREMRDRFKLTDAQAYWAETENTDIAMTDGESVDDLAWRFQQEYPCTIEEAFRAGRKGGYISAQVTAAARQRKNPHQPDMPLIIGCDFACGGGGANSEQILAHQLTGTAQDRHGVEDGDSNCFISHRGRVKGAELYDRFKDRDTVSVANRLAAIIVRLQPDRVFMDRGGGGGGVYDLLSSRGMGHLLELVDFGAGVDDPQYRNMRAKMHGEFREWLQDGDIPDDPLLESEITSAWVLRDDGGLILAPKREIRQKLKVSPDGSDACVLCHAGPVWKNNHGSIRAGGAHR